MTEIERSTAAQARELTDRIKAGSEALWELIKQAWVSGAHHALGYSSWDDYCTREFGSNRIRIPKAERPEEIASMRSLGMSTRAIATATGVSKDTVRREIATGANEPVDVTGVNGKIYTPRPASQPKREVIATPASEWPAGKPAPVMETPFSPATGIDKDDLDELNTPQPTEKPTMEPAKPKRTPITEAALTAVFELGKALNRLESITKDDRFPKNKTQIRDSHLSDLGRAQDALNNIIQNISN